MATTMLSDRYINPTRLTGSVTNDPAYDGGATGLFIKTGTAFVCVRVAGVLQIWDVNEEGSEKLLSATPIPVCASVTTNEEKTLMYVSTGTGGGMVFLTFDIGFDTGTLEVPVLMNTYISLVFDAAFMIAFRVDKNVGPVIFSYRTGGVDALSAVSVDTVDPSNDPTVLDTLAGGSSVFNFDIDGDLLIAGSSGTDALLLFNISNPNSLSLAFTYTGTPPALDSVRQPRFVRRKDGILTAQAISYANGAFNTVKVEAAAPFITNIHTGAANPTLERTRDILSISDQYSYTTSGSGIIAIDVSNLAAPKIVDVFKNQITTFTELSMIKKQGSRAFATNRGTDGIDYFNALNISACNLSTFAAYNGEVDELLINTLLKISKMIGFAPLSDELISAAKDGTLFWPKDFSALKAKFNGREVYVAHQIDKYIEVGQLSDAEEFRISPTVVRVPENGLMFISKLVDFGDTVIELEQNSTLMGSSQAFSSFKTNSTVHAVTLVNGGIPLGSFMNNLIVENTNPAGKNLLINDENNGLLSDKVKWNNGELDIREHGTFRIFSNELNESPIKFSGTGLGVSSFVEEGSLFSFNGAENAIEFLAGSIQNLVSIVGTSVFVLNGTSNGIVQDATAGIGSGKITDATFHGNTTGDKLVGFDQKSDEWVIQNTTGIDDSAAQANIHFVASPAGVVTSSGAGNWTNINDSGVNITWQLSTTTVQKFSLDNSVTGQTTYTGVQKATVIGSTTSTYKSASGSFDCETGLSLSGADPTVSTIEGSAAVSSSYRHLGTPDTNLTTSTGDSVRPNWRNLGGSTSTEMTRGHFRLKALL